MKLCEVLTPVKKQHRRKNTQSKNRFKWASKDVANQMVAQQIITATNSDST